MPDIIVPRLFIILVVVVMVFGAGKLSEIETSLRNAIRRFGGSGTGARDVASTDDAPASAADLCSHAGAPL